MIKRPNVRARCYQPNLQARHPDNRKYYPRSERLYAKQCRWCKRPRQWLSDPDYPRLCDLCSGWLKRFEWNATIIVDGTPANVAFVSYLAGYRSDDDEPFAALNQLQ